MHYAPLAAAVLIGNLCPHSRRQAKPHSAKAAGGKPCPWLLHLQVQGTPHLMLPHIRGKSKLLAAGSLCHAIHGPRHSQPGNMIIIGIFAAPATDFLPPVLQPGHRLTLHQHGKNSLHVAGQPYRAGNILVNFRRVNIHMDKLGSHCVFIKIACLAVSKAAAQ